MQLSNNRYIKHAIITIHMGFSFFSEFESWIENHHFCREFLIINIKKCSILIYINKIKGNILLLLIK